MLQGSYRYCNIKYGCGETHHIYWCCGSAVVMFWWCCGSDVVMPWTQDGVVASIATIYNVGILIILLPYNGYYKDHK